ncbi:MAG: 2Fe-2S iron-sulfur cluster-binding protein, partial [Pseudomonadota bacterium]
MNQVNRIEGGLIDRRYQFSFKFNGQKMFGHKGDTLASALLANGQVLVGRSFKYHRPRGVFTAGSEEPNALVELREGAQKEPNTRATMVELFDGLTAKSQNHRGSLKHDLLAINDLLSPFLSAGFYYKTFMWPKAFWEKLYEPVIRAAAGLGKLSMEDDPDSYDKGFLHCDLLVIGSGPAGLISALIAARAGARVILADEDFRFGGRLNAETYALGGMACANWAEETVAELASMKNVRLMSRTTIYGAYDHGIYGALERKTDHLADAEGKPRQVLWRIYSKRAILAAGSTERPIAFPDNDRPGIMLSGAVRSYVNRFGVAPGKQVVVFTNNDDGWRTASDLVAKGVEVNALIDSRDTDPVTNLEGVRIHMNTQITGTIGRRALGAIKLSDGAIYPAECLAVSGGWNPNVHLTCHQRGRPEWRDDLCAFVPGADLPVGMAVAGAANGAMTLAASMAEAQEKTLGQLESIGFYGTADELPQAEDEPLECSAFWHVKNDKKRAWVDLQNDVTVKDIKLANTEGFRSVELLKRYTTLGMATDQGKLSNINGLAVLAQALDEEIPRVGTTTFRPPYTPISLAAIAGEARGPTFQPTRRTPLDAWHEGHGAHWEPVGQWRRPY